MNLDAIEIRALGALIEKQITTPEYYPLTLNALVVACNQTTNRDPVTTIDEIALARSLESLRHRSLVWNVTNSRAPKFGQRFQEALGLSPAETAVMCVLMLRGPQTGGEIRGRTGRLHAFADLPAAEAVIEGLSRREPPLVVRLPRVSGARESRYAQLLGGAPEGTSGPVAGAPGIPLAGTPGHAAGEQAVEALRRELEELRSRVESLERRFE